MADLWRMPDAGWIAAGSAAVLGFVKLFVDWFRGRNRDWTSDMKAKVELADTLIELVTDLEQVVRKKSGEIRELQLDKTMLEIRIQQLEATVRSMQVQMSDLADVEEA